LFTNTQTGSDRLSQWRDFRHRTDITTPNQVLHVFENLPVQQRYIDYYTPTTWPSVFEIVSEGLFCQSGITLMIAATLDYFNFINVEQIRLDAISNHISGAEGLVLVNDGLVYNFIPGQVITEAYLREHSTCYDSHIITIDKLYS